MADATSNEEMLGIPGPGDILKAVKDVGKDIKNITRDVGGIGTKAKSLVDHLVVDAGHDLKVLSAEAQNLAATAATLAGKAGSAVKSLEGSALHWDQRKGANAKQALIQFANRARPVMSKLLSDHGQSTKPVALLTAMETLSRQIDASLFAPLGVLTDYVDLNDAATRLESLLPALNKREAAMRGEPGAEAPKDIVKDLKTVQAAMKMITTVLDYIVKAFPLNIGIGGKGGVAAGVAAAASVDMKVVAVMPFIVGLLSAALTVLSSGIDIAVIWLA